MKLKKKVYNKNNPKWKKHKIETNIDVYQSPPKN